MIKLIDKIFNKSTKSKPSESEASSPALTKVSPGIFQTFLLSLPAKTNLLVIFNDEQFYLPKETLLTMYHCVYMQNQKVILYVETAHYAWLRDRIRDGVFFDIGAATGAFALPMSKYVKRVIAFEPSKATIQILDGTISANGLSNIETVQEALFSEKKEIEFVEYAMDPSCPFAPEMSCIKESNLVADKTNFDKNEYLVEATTLDSLEEKYGALLNSKKVGIKIDVEGFEGAVLEGGQKFISKFKPYLTIDIHQSTIDLSITTEGEVRAILEKLGYSFEKAGHVLLCTPIS